MAKKSIKQVLNTCTKTITFQGWFIWFLAGLFYLFEFVHRVAPTVMVPELQRDFSVSASALGSLSACYYYAYASIQIPVGLLLDKYGTRNLLTFAAALIALGSLLFATTNILAVGKLSRALIGLGSAFSFVGCLKLGTSWFPAKRLALIVGLTNLLGILGAILGSAPLAWFIDTYDWRQSLFLSMLIATLFVFLLFRFVEDYPLCPPMQKKKDNLSFWDTFKTVASTKQLWLVALYGSLMVAPIAAYSELWGVSFLTTRLNVTRPVAAQIASWTFVGIAFGGPCIGWLSDKIGSRRQPMFLGALGALLSTSLLFYLPNITPITATLLHLSFGFFTSTMLLCFSLNAELVPLAARGTSIGVTNTIIMGASVIFQPLVGKLLDISALIRSAKQFITQDFQTAFVPLSICQAIALLLFFIIKEPSKLENSKADKL